MRILVASAACFFLSATLAVAQQTIVRTLPDDAKSGVLSYLRGNIVLLDGKPLRLAPGSQIRSADNLIVLPAKVGRDAVVRYKLDQHGDLSRVWILTPREAAHVPVPTLLRQPLDAAN